MAIIRKQKQIIKGAHLMIFVKNTTSGEYEPIAFANSHTLSKTLNTKELASKDFGDASAVLPQNYSWTMQTDNLYSLNGYRQLNDIFRQMRRVKIYFGESSYKQDKPQNSIVDKDGAVDWMTDGFGEEGFAYITSLDVTATAGENATFTATFTGTGPLTEIESGYSKKYLTFEALEDTTFTFTQNALQYSLDNGATWTTLAAGTATPTVTAGNKILWKQTGLTPSLSNGIGTFSATGNFDAYGNIMSLLYGDNFIGQTDLTGKDYAFRKLFSSNTKLVNTENLILPAITLARSCYEYMFRGCNSLITAPELPATTLASYCYYYMFNGCLSLLTAPELPATTLASYCYYYMFRGCNSLITAPELPATTLASYCYYYMFNGCLSLLTAPELPATTLASSCYDGMFGGCTSLTTAPELPATTLASSCYGGMFRGCNSLITAPELPATTLAGWCYSSMFSGCRSLTAAPELPATILAENCYYEMFYNCTSLTAAPELPATTLASSCYGGMFTGCTSLTAAPELPATTLANICYQYMFDSCTSLTAAPELPATTLTQNCYRGMFRDCTLLNYIKCLATDISAYICTQDWVSCVAATGTFVKNPSMNAWTTGTDGIPNNWTQIDA